MEVKKSPKADLEGKKSTWLLIGYVVVLAFMFVAFEWTERDIKIDTSQALSDLVFEEEMVPITEQEQKIEVPPPPEVPAAAEIFDVVEKMPEFPGGNAALMSYLAKNIKYPTIAQENGTQGRVIVQFVVNKDGSIVDAKVARSVDPYLDKEALRVINSMPKWNPGMQRNKPVRVKYTVPVMFRLQ